MSFAAAWKRKKSGVFGATKAHYLSLSDPIAAKEAAGRSQDLAVLAVLRRVQKHR